MRAWWRKRRHPAPTGGKDALRAATANLAEARAQSPAVREVADSLRDLRERNHFAETLTKTMRARRP